MIGLSTEDLGRLTRFRGYVEDQEFDNYVVTLFPREGLVSRYSLSALLRDDLEEYDVPLIPNTLFWRYKDLKGSVRFTHLKRFKPGDKTK